ncbi:MAG TPA: HipA family kinase [Pseudolabrys sp.]|nr:HipA family kinase [Pseudolabrys sp.]
MLACGTIWRPNEVKRVIETLRTSTRVAKVATDDGIGFLKGMGNPAGLDSLACELVGTELARWFGLHTPAFSIINVRGIEIPMDGVGNVLPGPAFISQEVSGATGDGGDAFLSNLQNPDDVSKLVVFDTWIRNGDRYPADEQWKDAVSNRDNIFFKTTGSKFELTVFDHTHCFTESTLGDGLSDTFVLQDDRVYGYFPEFKHYIKAPAVRGAVGRLRQMDRKVALEVVGSIPEEWKVSKVTRERWAEVICERAKMVSEFIVPKILADAGLGL